MKREPAELIDQRVAARIRGRRMDMGITLQALAQQIGVAFQQAHKYERGLSRISAGRLYHVACALKAPVGFFFASGDSPARDKPEPATALPGAAATADTEAPHATGAGSA
jgi:transcriptional regulator with XRE-family HTH domain